jgi:hypothetical protein
MLCHILNKHIDIPPGILDIGFIIQIMLTGTCQSVFVKGYRGEQFKIGQVVSCYRFSCYYRFSDIAINSVNPSFI